MKTPAVTIVAAWINAETGGRSLHRVGQPGMQPDLRRFAHRADEQQDAQRGQRMNVVTEELEIGVDLFGRRGEHGVEADRVVEQEHAHDAEREAEIADPVDHEGLDRRGVGGRPVIPEADQEVGAQADAFPAEEHLNEIVRRHQHQHEESEEVQVGHEPRDRRVVAHIADRIDVDAGRDQRHHRDHHGRQRVEAQRPGDLERARGHPGEDVDGAAGAAERDIEEHHDAEHGRERHRPAGHQLGGAVADQAAAQTGDDRADQRQENDRCVHALNLSSD